MNYSNNENRWDKIKTSIERIVFTNYMTFGAGLV
jgi:hypothetical protein